MTIRELSLQEHSEAFGTFQEPSKIFFWNNKKSKWVIQQGLQVRAPTLVLNEQSMVCSIT